MGKLLPLGSIITLEGSLQKIMIYGRRQLQVGQNKAWDYLGCFYPYGFINNEYNIFFNHSNISNVIFMGFEDEEEISFVKRIVEIS